jgi:hypothetical protein
MAVLTTLLLALQADAPSAVADAILKTRAEKSYEVAFSGEGRLPNGDPIKRAGKGLRLAPGVLILDYEISGGKKVRAVRAGVLQACPAHGTSFKTGACDRCGAARTPSKAPRVWSYANAHGRWMTSDEASEAGAASGFQNPDDLLEVLSRFAANARPGKDGLGIDLKGDDAAKAAGALAPGHDWDPKEAMLSAVLKADLQGRLATVSITASLRGAAGPAKLAATLEVGKYGQAELPRRLGSDQEPVPFSLEVRAALEEELRPR